MQNVKFKGYNGDELYCYLWDGAENPKAVVQLAHGMSEHAGRYAEFAEFLNKHGYIVFADDHRAHGLTETDETRGHHEGDIFADTLRDEVMIYNYLKEKYGLPVLFLGHSYGSFLGQAFLQQNTDVGGVALVGSGVMSALQTGAGLFFSAPIYMIKKDARMSFLNEASDFLFGLKYKDDKGKHVWLTRDKEFRAKLKEDKNMSIPMSVSFCRSLLKGVQECSKVENLAKVKVTTPIGIFSGDMDPIGNFGKGVRKLKKRYEDLGVMYLDYHEYKGARHEVLNEINRDEAYGDILNFFDKCLKHASGGEKI